MKKTSIIVSRGAHGDIIKFTMETEGLNFIESVDKLANLAGLEVPKQDPIERAKEARPKDVKGSPRGSYNLFRGVFKEGTD